MTRSNNIKKEILIRRERIQASSYMIEVEIALVTTLVPFSFVRYEGLLLSVAIPWKRKQTFNFQRKRFHTV